MNPARNIAFENGQRVPVVEFALPAEDEASEMSPTDYRLQGFRLAMGLFIDWISEACNSRSRDTRLEALRYVFTGSTAKVTDIAKRLKVRRETFSRAVSHIRRSIPLR